MKEGLIGKLVRQDWLAQHGARMAEKSRDQPLSERQSWVNSGDELSVLIKSAKRIRLFKTVLFKLFQPLIKTFSIKQKI